MSTPKVTWTVPQVQVFCLGFLAGFVAALFTILIVFFLATH